MDGVYFVLEDMVKRKMRLDLGSWEVLVKSFYDNCEIIPRLLIDITSSNDEFLD